MDQLIHKEEEEEEEDNNEAYKELQNQIKTNTVRENINETEVYRTVFAISKELIKNNENSAIAQKSGDIFLKEVGKYTDLLENNYIPLFVMLFFKIPSIPNIIENPKSIKENVDNFYAVIEFLKQKDIKFTFLQFKFDYVSNIYASIITFFTNFLNCFYLKTSRNEMYERCETLLLMKKKFEHPDNFFELTTYDTYFGLLHYLTKGNLNFDFSLDQLNDDSAEKIFNDAKIPKVINQNILNNAQNFLFPDCIFYQLQFIFDAIDSASSPLRANHIIIENILSAMKMIKKIKIPPFKVLKNSTKAKKSSLKYRQKKTDFYSDLSQSSEIFNIEKLSDAKITFQKYKDRHNKPENSLKTTITSRNEEQSKKTPNIFLDRQINNFVYENEILYDKLSLQINQNESEKHWNDIFQKFQSNDSQPQNEINLTGRSSTFSIYHLFIYNENDNKWTFQQSALDAISEQKFGNNKDELTPIILFLNSRELDSIKTISTLSNILFFDLNDENNKQQYGNISVLAITEKPMFESQYTPICLFLHVPKEKENIPNIAKIIIQIYSFLSMISDVEVVILNKDHFVDQVFMTKLITTIADKYEKKHDSDVKKLSSFISSSGSTDPPNVNNLKFIYNKAQVIYLMNDATIQFSDAVENNVNQNQFLQSFTALKNRESHVHYFDLYKFETLRPISHIPLDSSYQLIGLYKNFKFVEKMEISEFYINLMINQQSWKTELKQSILERFSQLKSNQNQGVSDISLISELGNEIRDISPPFDIDFLNEAYSILADLKKDATKNYKETISNELKISANSHLSYLENKIKESLYLTKEQILTIKLSHINILKDEMRSIIQGIAPDSIYDYIYEENIDVLDNLIDEDIEKLNNCFIAFEEKIKKKEEVIKVNMTEDSEKGLNYSMRETEHLREIMITIESDEDFESQIPQDF